MPIAHSVVGVIVNWHVSSYDGFSKMAEKPIDMFPRTDGF